MKHLLLITLLMALSFKNIQAANYKSILSNPENYRPVQLVHNSLQDYLLVPVKINGGKTQYFLLDTGMTSTSLTLKSAKAAGLKLLDTQKENSGVAGKSKGYTVKIDSLVIGSSRYSDLHLAVSDIPALENARNYSGIPIAGLLGSDILANLNAVIDYGSGILFIPKAANNTGLAKALTDADFTRAPFVNYNEYKVPVLHSEVAGHESLLICDSGAKASLLTKAFIKAHPEIQVFNTTTRVSGISGNALSRQAYVKHVKFAGVHATDKGFIVADLSHMAKEGQKRWSGIIGSDLMFPSKTLIDYGSKAIYSATLKFNASDYGKAGTYPGSKAQILARMAKCEVVASGKMTQLVFDKEDPIKDANGNSYLKATITFQSMKTLKGTLAVGKKTAIKVIVPNTKTAQRDLIDQAMTQQRRILLIPIGANGRRILFSQTFIRTSAIRDAHLSMLLKK